MIIIGVVSLTERNKIINTHIFKPQEYKGKGRDHGIGDWYGKKPAEVSFYEFEPYVYPTLWQHMAMCCHLVTIV